jgi:uncharacterized protein YndB with AHSA1/START domain
MAALSSGTATVTLPTDEQILITREFDVPRHLVYKAWTTPELVKRWWNAKRGEVTVAEIDLRVGGMWRYVMVTEDGFEVGFHGEYREIVPNERLVSTEVYEGVGGEGTLNARPALGGDRERFLRGFLGEIEVAEEADQARQDAAPLVAEDLLEDR